jgi:Ca2+-transporting ATPase
MTANRLVDAAFALDAAKVAEDCASDLSRGLAEADAVRRLQRYGANRLREHKTRSVLAILAHQFTGIIVWLLAGAALLSLVLQDLADAVAIAVVLLLNGAIGFFTELRAARSMEALMRITEVTTRVRRDGRVREIDARDLVPGDIVVLEAGDIVTADLRLVSVSNLFCDESLLTGESAAVAKQTAPVAADTAVADRTNMAFSGTAVTQGLGEGIVVATGMATQLGHISALAEEAEDEASPLEQRLDRLGQKLVWLTLVLASITSLAGILWGNSIPDMIKTGVALAVAAIPEGLPVVASLCLARGMLRMAARNAIVTQLSSVETLGATTLILTDKTGTLTENRMSVVRYLIDAGDVDVQRDGEGRHFRFADRNTGPAELESLDWALKIGVLCNTAELHPGEGGTRIGDPMELALLAVAGQAEVTRASLSDEFRQVRQHAFDPGRKMMATVFARSEECVYAVKGAPEFVLEASRSVLVDGAAREMSDADRAAWRERSDLAARAGLRVLALAMKKAATDGEPPYEDLTLIALVCFLDPLRNDVPAAIRASLDAGVRVVMMTGDHADTAATIAGEAGLGAPPLKVLTGREIAGFDPDTAGEGMRDGLLATDVFARVSPDTKLKLVSLFQDQGHVVAMTGDGVNDAPALKKADIGIAMGQRGTQVAREASDIVLKDDAFATIIAAMRQGRTIFENIRKFVVYLMSCNVSEVLIVGIAVGIGLPVPLLPLQILFLNLVTDVFPAFALGLGKGDDEIMSEPPRDPREPIVDRPRWLLIGLLGGAITLATLSAFTLALFHFGLDTDAAVTVAFLTLALAQLWNVFNVRRPSPAVFRNDVSRNPFVWGALALCLGLLALAMQNPMLSEALNLHWPGRDGLLLALGMSVLPLVFGQVYLVVSWLTAAGEVAADPPRRAASADPSVRGGPL